MKFILQPGQILQTEKFACRCSSYQSVNCSFDTLELLSPQSRDFLVPVGSVEYVRKFSEHLGITLPTSSCSYPSSLKSFLLRKITTRPFSRATLEEFVKPLRTKSFTGGIKKDVLKDGEANIINPEELVWVSEPVEFESEFRFYVLRDEILGFCRYDDLPVTNPPPSLEFVREMAKLVDSVACSIDIGWRKDLSRYCLVEVNDAWSLGLYKNSDPQSSPPTNQQYADMLVQRWGQILDAS